MGHDSQRRALPPVSDTECRNNMKTKTQIRTAVSFFPSHFLPHDLPRVAETFVQSVPLGRGMGGGAVLGGLGIAGRLGYGRRGFPFHSTPSKVTQGIVTDSSSSGGYRTDSTPRYTARSGSGREGVRVCQYVGCTVDSKDWRGLASTGIHLLVYNLDPRLAGKQSTQKKLTTAEERKRVWEGSGRQKGTAGICTRPGERED